jgi:hypothetical protein
VLARGGRLILAELKSQKGKPSEDQLVWDRALTPIERETETVQIWYWRPAEWFDGTIEAALR